MGQFDIYRLTPDLLVVDLQTDLIAIPETRLVAPLRDTSHFVALPGITPLLDLESRTYVVRLQEMAAIRAPRAADKIGSAAHLRDDIFRGLDILTHGF